MKKELKEELLEAYEDAKGLCEMKGTHYSQGVVDGIAKALFILSLGHYEFDVNTKEMEFFADTKEEKQK